MLTWSIVAVLKLRSSCAAAAVPLAASIASPRTRSRRLSEPCSKRATRLEMIDSMAASLAQNLDLEFGLGIWTWRLNHRTKSGRFHPSLPSHWSLHCHRGHVETGLAPRRLHCYPGRRIPPAA